MADTVALMPLTPKLTTERYTYAYTNKTFNKKGLFITYSVSIENAVNSTKLKAPGSTNVASMKCCVIERV